MNVCFVLFNFDKNIPFMDSLNLSYITDVWYISQTQGKMLKQQVVDTGYTIKEILV